MDIFVGNLLFEATEGDVKKLFEGFGNVASVVIVMRKEKKTPKSRGFGFVQMPDEQQALAAIAALNGKEFMGRVLYVESARPKKEVKQDNTLKEERKKTWFSPVFNKHLALKDGRVRLSGQPGTYRGGRRTRSYMSQRGLDGMQEEAKPRRRSQDNPMQWHKRGDQSRPWKKTEDESKPWRKTESKPESWRKSNGRTQKSRFKGRKNPGGYKR